MTSNPDPVHLANHAVRLSGIVKSFGDGNSRLTVLKGIDLDARSGEIMMLVGPSGCGKTTLLSIMAGTLHADQGGVEVFGTRLDKMKSAHVTKFRAQNIGFIFQSFNLIPTINCAENVSVPLLIQGTPARKAEARAKELLAAVGLGDRWHHRPTQLSGGQQQRVAIARALVHEPRLIICDEPTASLDAKNGTMVMELFDTVAKAPGRAVIIVTHDNRIFSHADRIAQMDDGQIVEVHDVDKSRPPELHH
ncbi:ABC transporter ATP-binding protein [Verrucomicrobium sp. BvORR034]|jgi:putative ABC transport system ATP-binding protein|uniref:ABC transporter ATP-binding protein n=2 Tax=unclassified Verrucomicrobium TaxID=2625155 RepID=UPI0006786668|nr:ABC transporter ATP-binding protein [Verrucomicrobium sp. BvORR034]